MPPTSHRAQSAEPCRSSVRISGRLWVVLASLVILCGVGLAAWQFSHRRQQVPGALDADAEDTAQRAGAPGSFEPALPPETEQAIAGFTEQISNLPTSVAFSADGKT